MAEHTVVYRMGGGGDVAGMLDMVNTVVTLGLRVTIERVMV